MPDLGTVHKVELRKLWPHEAHDFTPWLASNLELLGEAIGFDLELTEQESCVGAFFCDLVAREINTDRVVIIENQLEAADHGHLGQLMTYAAGKEASIVIWIASEIRDEYRQALTWLNSRTDSKTEFFGIVAEAFQIDESRPAVNFKLIASPNEWRKKAAEATTRNASTKDEKYQLFFQPIVDELREKHSFTNSKRAQPQNWMTFSSGVNGAVYGLNFPQGNKVRVELYIDFEDEAFNKAFFDALHSMKAEIEASLGSLSWERLDHRRASRIAIYRQGFINSDAQVLTTVHQWGIEQLLNFKKILGPKLPTARTLAEKAVELVDSEAVSAL